MERTAHQIIETFQKAGFQAYLAGGCVRDMLMEVEPQDYDIATSARPEEIEALMKKTYPIGKQFGVILVEQNGHHFEVATFRSDSAKSDGRRPDAVIFSNPEEDAKRRDFTINGLFFDPIQHKVLDFVGGQQDIQNKIIRFIGDPKTRIAEDHLRILRAVRFKNQFNYQYDPATKKTLREYGYLVKGVSQERIQEELTKMLLSPRRGHAMRELSDLGILELLVPEVTACKGVPQPPQYHKEGDLLDHLLKAIHSLPQEWGEKTLVWAIFLHDIGKPETLEVRVDRIHYDGHAKLSAKKAGAILRRLKFSRTERLKIEWLIAHHMNIGFIPSMRRAHQIKLFMHPWFADLLKLHYCDESGSLPVNLNLYETVKKMAEEWKNEKLLPTYFKPLLSGNEVMEILKIPPGPTIKKILSALHEEQLEGKIKTKKTAQKFIKNWGKM